MSKNIILNNQSSHEIRPVERREFFSRDIELSDEQYVVFTKVYGDYMKLREYLTEVYEKSTIVGGVESVTFPFDTKPAPKPKAKPKAKPRARKGIEE